MVVRYDLQHSFQLGSYLSRRNYSSRRTLSILLKDMKHLLFILFILFSNLLHARPLTIMNESNVSIDVILWRDSNVIFHQVLTPNSEITVEDIGHGLLIQYKLIDVVIDQTSKECNHIRLLSNNYIEVELTDDHFNEYLKWYQPFVSTFSLDYQIKFIEPKA